MARYEFSDGRSHKFWEITVEGNRYTVVYGRIGTVGQSSTKEFADAATAEKKAQAAIASKIKKGYREVSGTALAEEQGEVDSRLVLADQLQEQGDPRGQLIALQHKMSQVSGKERAELKKQENKLLDDHEAALLGPLAEAPNAASTTVIWKLGFWEKITIFADYNEQKVETAALLGALLAHPSAAHLEELHIGIPDGVWAGQSDWQASLDQLAAVGAPELRRLHLADDEDNAEISWCEIGDLSKVWKAVPNLEFLRIRGVGVGFGEVVAPKLHTLRIVSGGLPAEPVRAISAADLPALEFLEIYFGTDEYGADATIDDVAGILSGARLPRLRWLGLKNGEFMGEIAAAVVHAPVLKRLKVLDLSLGTLQDAEAQPLLEHADALKHLDLLDLSENFLSDDLLRRLAAVLPKVRAHEQKDAYEDDDEGWFYTSVAE